MSGVNRFAVNNFRASGNIFSPYSFVTGFMFLELDAAKRSKERA